MFINGHGTSIPNSYKFYDGVTDIPTTIKLKPNQYIIMYKERSGLSGSEWIQENIWSEIAHSKKPLDFIQNIRKIKKDSGEEYFRYYGSHESESVCPNLHIFMQNDDQERLYTDRFGIFSAPISINNDFKKYLLDNKKNSLPDNYEYRLLSYIPNYNLYLCPKYLEYYQKQWNLLNVSELSLSVSGQSYNLPPITFPIYYSNEPPYNYNFLDEFVYDLGDSPFILFCNICRNIEKNYNYPDDITSQNLSELEEHFRPRPLDPNAKKFIPAQKQSTQMPLDPEAEPFIPAKNPPYKQKYLKYKNKYLKLKSHYNKLNR